MKTKSNHISEFQRGRAVMLAASVWLACGLAPRAGADTIYAYIGNSYTDLGGSYESGGPYALSVQFTTTLTGSALRNLPFANISSTITSYSFTDGSGLVLNNANNGLTNGNLLIQIATDASGNIVGWLVGAYNNLRNTQMQSNWKSPHGFIDGADFSETTQDFAGNYGFIGNDPGIWSATTIPLPGTLYEAHNGSGTVNQFTLAGSKSLCASGLSGPIFLAFDGAGDLFVTGVGNGTITKIAPGGGKTTFASGLNSPLGLAVDNAGNLYESDSASGNLYKFPPGYVNGQTPITFATGLVNPAGLAFDGAGNLFVANEGQNAGNGAIVANSGSITEITTAGAQSTFAAGLDVPTGLAFDGGGKLLGTEFGADLVHEFPAGFPIGTPLVTFASGFGLDGPCGITFDNAGNLFVSNERAGKIYEYPSGYVNGQTPVTFASGLNLPAGLAFQGKSPKYFLPYPITISISPLGQPVLTWTGGFLQSATNVSGPFTDVVGAVSPFTVPAPALPQQYFRLRLN